MRAISKVFLGLLGCAVFYGLWWSGMNYTGYCHAQGRYLSEEELINLSVKNAILTFPPVIRTIGNDNNSFIRPIKFVAYSGVDDFFEKNINCCEITLRGDEGYKVSLYSRLTGSVYGLVHMRYLVEFKNNDSIDMHELHESYSAISNCGVVWEGI